MSRDSYLYQGRQQHGWFGHGTAPHELDGPEAHGEVPEEFGGRMGRLLHAAAELLPHSTRGHPALRTGARELGPLTTAAAAWAVHDRLNDAEFGKLLRPGWVPEHAVDGLRRAAEGAAHAESRAELGKLAEGFAATLQTVGVDHWPALVRESALLAQRQGQAGDMLQTIAARRARGRAAGALPVTALEQTVPGPAGLPSTGEASTYSDAFVGRLTSRGEHSPRYSHEGYTAALLPRARWNAVPLGTRARLTYQDRSVVVEINDRGAGTGHMARVLDLSRAAMAYLTGRRTGEVTDQNAGVIQLERIEIVPSSTPLGPVQANPR